MALGRPDDPVPYTRLLSNGRYRVLLYAANRAARAQLQHLGLSAARAEILAGVGRSYAVSGCAATPIACTVDDGHGTIDGAAAVVQLVMDGAAHRVTVTLGKA